MKNSPAVFLLLALLAVLPVHNQNRSDNAAPPRRVPFQHPGGKRHFDKFGMNSSDWASFQGRDYSRPWRSAMEHDYKRSQRRMNSPRGAFERSRHEQNTPLRNAAGSNEAQSFSNDVPVAWVNHYASQSLAGIDNATALAIDGSGNVYVTGNGTGSPFGTVYLTVKYNATGTQLWTAQYAGDGQAENLAHAITVDAVGNVYVTGESYDSGTSWDYATIKYNAAGVQQWVARYNGPGNSGDYAYALAVDSAGNVYVTGESKGSGTSDDYATIKYNAAGVEQWVARYNGPGNSDDDAAALAIDNAGNVYVTGRSEDSGTFYDYATIKYNAAGERQWLARYNRAGSSFDYAIALAVDNAGYVYVTGTSDTSITYSNSDYTTIKYNAAGEQQWVTIYNGPENSYDGVNALAIDGGGNVYVTGSSSSSAFGTSYDYATIKYNTAGAQQWVARYDGLGNSSDGAIALTVDVAGNVYVTGTSADSSGASSDYATIKYNAAGAQQWVTHYNGPRNDEDFAKALAVDGAGNVYVTGTSADPGTSDDYATLKYNAAGVGQWVARYDGPGNSVDEAKALAVDGAGNIYVAGYSTGSGTSEDYATLKYNAAGVQQWVARYNGPGNSYDAATIVAVDGAGNVYVTGTSEGSGTFADYATIKYNAAGVQQWVARYDGPGNSIDWATALAVDGAGNVYVTGNFTIKYNAAGIQQWVVQYNGVASALAIDGIGNVYVTGSSEGSVTLSDFTTIKYNPAGVEQWVARYVGPGNSYDYANALAIDDAGNVYVTGISDSSGTSYEDDYVTIKYNAVGVQQWLVRYNGPGNDSDYATALTVDSAGNVYVTGASEGSGTFADYATIKYNVAGEQQWIARYNSPWDGGEHANDLKIDAAGNVYVTGKSESSGSSDDYDYVTLKYNAAGEQQWVARYNGPGSDGGGARALVLDSAGNVIVAGTSFGYYDWSIYTTIKYTQTTVSVKEKEPNKPTTFWLAQNYPNPFNPSTTIRYAIAKPSHVTLKVFNLQGQEVVTLVNENKPVGEYEIKWNPASVPSGVYLYRLQVEDPSGAGKFSETKKLILLR
jgi:uncharacterized delta-60 repeat protein